MTVYPQEYTLHCVKTGYDKYDITVSFQNDVVVVQGTGCAHDKPCNGIELHFKNKTYDHRANITWDGETVRGGLFNQSATGDHDYECIVEVTNEPIRRRNVTIQGNIIFNYKNISIVPELATEISAIKMTIDTIYVNWTALDSSDADGYVVNVTSDTDTVQTVQVEGSNNNTITLNGLRGGTTYSIIVRAYQQLLGPASSTISVQILPGIATIPVNVLVTLLMYF